MALLIKDDLKKNHFPEEERIGNKSYRIAYLQLQIMGIKNGSIKFPSALGLSVDEVLSNYEKQLDELKTEK